MGEIINSEDKEEIESKALLYTKAVLEAREKLENKKIRTVQDIRLHNTKILLENYRKFIGYVDNATYSFDKIQEQETLDWYKNIYDPDNRSDQIIASIKNSAVKTRIMVEHIKTTVRVYGDYCKNVGTDKMIRRYEAIFQKYISDVPLTNEQLAEKFYVDVRTVQKTVKEAVEDISSLFFGIDWLDSTTYKAI